MELTSEIGCMCSCHRKYLTRRVLSGFIIVLVIMSTSLDLSQAYNADLVTAVVHSGETKSMFGFSVALHQDQGSKWLLVGAPKAQTRQPGVSRGGAVYRCPTDEGQCQEIPFDKKGNNIRHNGTHYVDVEDKSDQWFGASLYSSSNGIIVACAPRYVYFSTRLDKREPVGTCYIARPSRTDYEEYSPCRSRVDRLPLVADQFHQQGSCQIGYSAVLTGQGRQLLIGAVGSWYWQGQVFNYNFEDGPGRYQATKEGRAKDDYSYMGYSSAVGNFDGDDSEDYVVGVPRGRQLQGKVVLYSQNLTLIDTIKGEQFGSYFGYDVAVTDLDKNGLDDIIVGAPLFSDFSTDNTYETGRVYIYYQSAKNGFTKKAKDILDGHDSQSRFGMAVASIGDIDQDGYNDIAIGAPYGGENGRGVVYIYHGSMKGIITDVQQAIKADDVLSGTETFGWSISGGIDMDDNEYPDLLIGSQQSNKAAFLRSRPVVQVMPTIQIDPVNITLGEEHENCVIGDKNPVKVTCVTVYTCLLYTGTGVPDKLDFELTLKFDTLKNDSHRVFFLHPYTSREDSKIIEAYKDSQKCFTFFGYLVKNVRDKLTPIVVEYGFNLHERSPRNKRDVAPILNQRIPTVVTAEANIEKNCGPDKQCISDLSITATQAYDTYTLGEDKKIEIIVMIENREEDAFESILNITFPPGVTFYRTKNKKFEIPMFCDTSSKNSSTVICDLGNPLPSKSKTNFTLVAAAKGIGLNGTVRSEPIFILTVNSSNSDSKYENNVAVVSVPIEQRANLRLGGNSNPEQFIYSDTDVKIYRETSQVGPVIEHTYVLNNLGPSAVKTSLVKIEWPYSDEHGLKYLYLEDDFYPTLSRPDMSCIIYNHTASTYSEGNGDNFVSQYDQDNQLNRRTRDTSEQTAEESKEKRDLQEKGVTNFVGCRDGTTGCKYIHCTIGYMEPDDIVKIKIKSKIWTSTLIHKKIGQPFYFVSKATAQVLSMPYPEMKVSASTYTTASFDVITYVNPERLLPKSTGVQAWIIGVAVSAGLLLLYLLIMLLWWCGFFRRRRPEEQAYLAPASTNGDYKNVQQSPPDSRYKYM